MAVTEQRGRAFPEPTIGERTILGVSGRCYQFSFSSVVSLEFWMQLFCLQLEASCL